MVGGLSLGQPTTLATTKDVSFKLWFTDAGVWMLSLACLYFWSFSSQVSLISQAIYNTQTLLTVQLIDTLPPYCSIVAPNPEPQKPPFFNPLHGIVL